MPDSWPNLSSETLTDQVYEVLREQILSGRWEHGRFMREQQISEKLGVSRTPVREALGRLASDRFVERVPRRGYRIPEQSPADLVDVYPVLARLEVLAASQSLPGFDAAALADLRDVNERYAQACARGDVRGGIEFNHQFHHRLSEPSGNQRLNDMLDDLRAEVTRLEIWAFSSITEWQESIREHEGILEAIELGDHETALQRLEHNRLMTHVTFAEMLASEHKWDLPAE